MKEEARVSELIVFGFRDQYRAAEVLNELKRREWEWAGNLDDAVAITIAQDGKARVQLSVDLSNGEAAAWARVWGSLLSVTLFRPSVGDNGRSSKRSFIRCSGKWFDGTKRRFPTANGGENVCTSRNALCAMSRPLPGQAVPRFSCSCEPKTFPWLWNSCVTTATRCSTRDLVLSRSRR